MQNEVAMNRIKNKTVIITGATSGIGAASAKLFAEYDTKLVLTGRRKEKLEKLQSTLTQKYNISVDIAVFDIRNREECQSFAEKYAPSADILVNNAGLALGTDKVHEFSLEDMDAMIDTNVKSLLTLTRLISPFMKEKNSGHIINLGSTAGHGAYTGGVIYCGTKHAVKAITEATKMDLHGTKVRVSMVSPGMVETEFSEIRYKGDQQKAKDVYKGLDPLTAQDIAEIIVFIANRPNHVNIMDTIIYPVYQSSQTMVYRDE